jgi:hypothetical protein
MDVERGRSIGVGFGVGSLLVVAAAILIASQPPKPSKPPDPAKAVVSATHVAGKRLGDDAAFTLRLHALGKPPTSAQRLVDSTGAASALVTPVPCPSKPDEDRWTGLTANADPPDGAANDWCFNVQNLHAGSTVKGTVKTDAAEVELTLGQRHSFWWGPFGVTLAGLLCGLFALAWPKWVRDVALNARLTRALARNSVAPTGSQIVDLAAKATAWKATKVSLPDRVDMIEWLIGPGVATVAQARVVLRDAMAISGLEVDSQIMRDAQTELATTDLKVDDLLDVERKPKRYVLGERADSLDRMARLNRQLMTQQGRIQMVPAGAERIALERAFTAATNAISSTPATGLDDLEKQIGELRESIDKANVPAVPAAAAAVPAIPPTKEPSWSALGIVGRAKSLIWLTALAYALAAMVSLYVVAYSTQGQFGTVMDYLGLFGAAAGSTTLASIVAVFGYWNGNAAAPEEKG